MNTGTANKSGSHLFSLANFTAVVIRKPHNIALINACNQFTSILVNDMLYAYSFKSFMAYAEHIAINLHPITLPSSIMMNSVVSSYILLTKPAVPVYSLYL